MNEIKNEFVTDEILEFQNRLENHSLYAKIQTMSLLVKFMSYHVYCVWDFMSLLKYLQQELTTVTVPWTPPKHPGLARFISEIILAEECDELPDGKGYLSHFELYLEAMKEVNAPAISTPHQSELPVAVAPFVSHTFSLIAEAKTKNAPEIVASAFTFGRENIIPLMFRSLLANMNIGRQEAPNFHYYLERHIDLDEGHHGPLAIRLLSVLCEDDPSKIREVQNVAIACLRKRIDLWSRIEDSL